jgi:hypothetical protein
MSPKAKRIVGWVLSGVIAALLVGPSAGGKFAEWEGKAGEFAKIGWTTDVMYRIGFVEVAVAILFLVPRVAFIGTILLTAYLGGAVATHVRINDQFFMPIVIGVLAWIALGLRDPRVFTMALEPPRSEPSQ